MDLKLVAQANLHNLSLNTYPGRGLFMGLGADGKAAYQGCWTMGRSAGSRNRHYVEVKPSHLRTEVANPDLEKGDPATTIYSAMREIGAVSVVSNGHQTDHATERAIDPLNIALADWKYEPDAPIYTPRITGRMMIRREGALFYEFSVLRKSPWGDECDRLYFTYDNLPPGFARCVTTYMENGNPPPHWQGEPYLVPISGMHEEILKTYWTDLNADNLVSVAVKKIPLDGTPSTILWVNRYPKKTPAA